jgi:tetratricopeptide (TPR) repeat protein
MTHKRTVWCIALTLAIAPAMSAFRAELAGTPAPVADLVQQAQAAQASGHYPEAQALWQQVIQRQPQSAEAYYQLGLALHRQYQFPGAIAAYRTATHLDPRYEPAYTNLGVALLQTGQTDDAAQAFRQVLRLPNQTGDSVSSHVLAHYNLAVIFRRQRHTSESRRSVERALQLAPDFAPAQQLLKGLN